ncbi:LuxR C-terminal-related transcriptional regulator [Halalkalibaculum sp. DA3122]|uniref:LuxR C-terminal-related transcriptional regulator n=1 Tax=unclassified Halalkalibaculum TaxID=2964617 RepID=UPI003753F1D3
MIKIIVSAEDILINEKIRKLMMEGPLQTNVLGGVRTTSELMGMLEQELPNIIIQHVGAGGMPKLDALYQVTYSFLGLPILAVGSGFDDDMVAEIIKAGAMGYLEVSNLDTVLAAAVDMLVSQKENFISKEVAKKLSDDIHMINLNVRKQRLSDKELKVMKMIAEGFDMQEIADELSVSVRTIYTYRSRVMEKMGLKSNIAIRHYVLDQHLIENDG